MEMPKNGKNQGSNKFIIKPKPSLNHIRSENVDPDSQVSTDCEADLFLMHMAQKSKRFKELLQEKNIHNEEEFCETHLFRSLCLVFLLLPRKLS